MKKPKFNTKAAKQLWDEKVKNYPLDVSGYIQLQLLCESLEAYISATKDSTMTPMQVKSLLDSYNTQSDRFNKLVGEVKEPSKGGRKPEYRSGGERDSNLPDQTIQCLPDGSNYQQFVRSRHKPSEMLINQKPEITSDPLSEFVFPGGNEYMEPHYEKEFWNWTVIRDGKTKEANN